MSGRAYRSDPVTSNRMRRVGQTDTLPEKVVRATVFSLGRRYRLNVRELPGRPDLANRGEGWAIFVHGCFWHAHPGCKRASKPKRNSRLWQQKLESNRARDARNQSILECIGFHVLVLWECEVYNSISLRGKLEHFFGDLRGRRVTSALALPRSSPPLHCSCRSAAPIAGLPLATKRRKRQV